MSAKSVLEEVLLLLLWNASHLARPRLRNLDDTFEMWQRRNGLHLRLKRLEERQLIERDASIDHLFYSLTATGHLATLGGPDLPSRWNRPWDGKIRQLLFDLPAHHRKTRMRLWRWMRTNGFGYLQQSVWIHPDPVPEILSALDQFKDDVESLIVMEAVCCQGYENSAVVRGAWEFDEINKRYKDYMANTRLNDNQIKELTATAETLGTWLRMERDAWRHALALDPVLPRPLWPQDYLGPTAWDHHLQTRHRLVHAIHTLSPGRQ